MLCPALATSLGQAVGSTPKAPAQIVPGTPKDRLRIINPGLRDAGFYIRSVQHPRATAPAAVYFELNTYGVDLPDLGPGVDSHAIYIDWVCDYGDDGDIEVVRRLPKPWARRSLGLGRRTIHTYQKPGTYIAKFRGYVQLFDGQRHSFFALPEERVTIHVADPDDKYRGDATIFIDPTGERSGLPEGAQFATDLLGARNLTTSHGKVGEGHARLLLRPGRRYELVDSWDFRARSTPDWHFASLGGDGDALPVISGRYGALPENHNSPVPMFDGGNDPLGVVQFDRVRLEGAWNSTTESTPEGQVLRRGLRFKRHLSLVVNRCEMDGLANNVQGAAQVTEGATEDHLWVVNENVITNWQDYAVSHFGGGENAIAIIGNEIEHKEDSCTNNHSDKKGRNNRHGSLRVAAAEILCVAQNSLFGRNSWGKNPAYQPGGRFNTAGALKFWGMVALNIFEGGPAFGGGPANGNPKSRLYSPMKPGTLRMCYNIMFGTTATRSFGGANMGGTCIDRNYVFRPGVPSYGAHTTKFFAATKDRTDGTEENWEAYLRIVGNTLINLQTRDIGKDLSEAQLIADLAGSCFGAERTEVRDNLVHVPNHQEHRHIPYLPMLHTGTIATRAARGPILETPPGSKNFVEHADMATPADALKILVPGFDSLAADGATGALASLSFIDLVPLPDQGYLGAIRPGESFPT